MISGIVLIHPAYSFTNSCKEGKMHATLAFSGNGV